MSHEGFRLLPEEQARRIDAEHAPLPREMTEPVKVRVLKTEGTGMQIDWRDGHRSTWSFAWLREACPCATCHDEREKEGTRRRCPETTAGCAAAPLQSPRPA